MQTTLIHAADLCAADIDTLTRVLPGELERRGGHYRLHHRVPLSDTALHTLRHTLALDINLLPPAFDPGAVGLVVSDMDATLIANECLDELAEVAGKAEQMRAITARAMRGEVDFSESLRRRVAMLRGLPLVVLEEIIQARMTLNPGAGELLAALKRRSIPFALVTGGFRRFAEHLQQELGFAYCYGIEPDIVDGVLSGTLPARLVDARVKADYLALLCEELAITASQVVAIGDGANDLAMLKAAGLGVAYRGKPVVQADIPTQLNYAALDAIVDFLE